MVHSGANMDTLCVCVMTILLMFQAIMAFPVPTRPTCGPHEMLDDCFQCGSEWTCDQIAISDRPMCDWIHCDADTMTRCACQVGFYRNADGECVLPQDCPNDLDDQNSVLVDYSLYEITPPESGEAEPAGLWKPYDDPSSPDENGSRNEENSPSEPGYMNSEKPESNIISKRADPPSKSKDEKTDKPDEAENDGLNYEDSSTEDNMFFGQYKHKHNESCGHVEALMVVENPGEQMVTEIQEIVVGKIGDKDMDVPQELDGNWPCYQNEMLIDDELADWLEATCTGELIPLATHFANCHCEVGFVRHKAECIHPSKCPSDANEVRKENANAPFVAGNKMEFDTKVTAKESSETILDHHTDFDYLDLSIISTVTPYVETSEKQDDGCEIKTGIYCEDPKLRKTFRRFCKC